MKKKIMLLVLVVCMLFGMVTPAGAAYAKSAAEPLADILYEEGLFQGTGMTERDEPIYQLYGSVTRAQAITMLVRILGKEDEALANKDSYETPFTDVPSWAVPYVGYAYTNALTSGTSATTFSPALSIPANQFLTFCLRALGYSSETDFSYADPYEFAQTVGFMSAMEYMEKPAFNRGDMVILSCDALLCSRKDSKKTLGATLGIEKDTLGSIASVLSTYTGEAAEKPLTAQSVLDLINQQRLEEMRYVPKSIMEISLSHEYDDLLSHEECQMLLKQKDRVRTVTKEQAMEDAEYLWKAFASAYGGYYYFGDETFKNAHQQVLSDIRACKGNTITYEQFESFLFRAYGFMKDEHIRFYRDKPRYVTYYVKGLFIREDTKGFYRLIDGEKWYLQAVDKGDISDYLQITIADTGELVYGFYHRFLSDKDSAMPKNLTLVSGEKTKNLSLKWTKSGAIGWEQHDTFGRFYATQNIDGHNVVKIRCFGYFEGDHYAAELEKYMETGNLLSGQDYVIVDSRSNGGGSTKCPLVWLNRFLGDREANMQHSVRNRLESSNVDFRVLSRLNEYVDKQDFPETVISQKQTEYPRERIISFAEQTPNEHPLFVLTDYLSGSAGEGIITQYRTVENVLIIGTNTGGCMFSNVKIQIYLPNTGYSLGFGQHATLEDFVNREGYGYDPDIWVPSEYALELTLKMCAFYGLQDPDAQPLPNYGELVERVSLDGYVR